MDWWELLVSSLIGAVLAFRFFFRVSLELLHAVFTEIRNVTTPKPGEATVAAAEAPAAVPRSTASNSGGSAADARPTGAGSEFVRAVDMVQWLGQVESQFRLVRYEMQAASAKTDACIAGTRDSVSTCAAQCAHLDIVLQQLVANQAVQGDVSRDHRDAPERLLHKSQLVDEAALRRKSGPRRHWILRGRIPHVLGDSPGGIQAFVGESFNVTAWVDAQLRSVSAFDVTQFGPRMDRAPDCCLVVADRPELVRSALLWVLSAVAVLSR